MRLPFFVRSPLSRLVRPIAVRIAAGPNAGRRWSLAAAGRYRGGHFEVDRMEVIQALVSSGDCFWDVGAHHGYVTLMASRLVGAGGAVYAFEPSPYNLALLRKHLSWNGCDNAEVVPLALSDHEGDSALVERGSSQTFRIGAGGRTVEAASLPALLDRGIRPPDVLKLDAEGSEGAILESAVPRLHRRCRVLVSIHSRCNYEKASLALSSRGFTLMEPPGLTRLRLGEPGPWPDDPDLLAIGPECQHLSASLRRLAYFRE